MKLEQMQEIYIFIGVWMKLNDGGKGVIISWCGLKLSVKLYANGCIFHFDQVLQQ